MTIPDIVGKASQQDGAIKRLQNYYTLAGRSGRKYFSGSHFDDFLAADNKANEFTSADLLSVSLLGVSTRGDAVVKILDQYPRAVSRLLAHLGPDKDLHTLDKCEFDARLGIDSPGEKLWNLLRGHRDKDYIGLGPTITSKLMARKRPGLIPIWDSRVGNQVGLRSTEHFWTGMWSAFQDEALVHNLRDTRQSWARHPTHISPEGLRRLRLALRQIPGCRRDTS